MLQYLTATNVNLRPYDSNCSWYVVEAREGRQPFLGLIFNDDIGSSTPYNATVTSTLSKSGDVALLPHRATLADALQDLLQEVNPIRID